MTLNHPVFMKYFPDGSYKPITIPEPVASSLEGKTLKDMPMAGFKKGNFPNKEDMETDLTGPLHIHPLTIQHPRLVDEGDLEEIFAIVKKDSDCLILFQGWLLTNFRNTEAMLKGVVIDKTTKLPLTDPETKLPKLFPIPIKCPEQTFKLGCADVHQDHPNHIPVMHAIFAATKPKFAKFATDGFSEGFKTVAWNSKSKAAMFRSGLGASMNEPAFNVYKQIGNDLAKNATLDHNLRIVEASPKDKKWGIGMGCLEAVSRLKAQALLTPSATLFDLADSVFAGGDNDLGPIILDVIRIACESETFEQHQERMRDFVFFNVEATPEVVA